jgi:hypothetical protein
MIDIRPTDPIVEIEGNPTRPMVFFDRSTGQLRLKGRSILENTIRLYEPLIAWIDNYIDNPAEITELHLVLEYFNTSTSKYILAIFEKLDELFSDGHDVTIYWYYSDEDMYELGTDYQIMLHMPFEFRHLELD